MNKTMDNIVPMLSPLNNVQYFQQNRSKANRYIIEHLRKDPDRFSCIIHHFFAWNKNKEWLSLGSVVDHSLKINKYKIRFYPSGMFTKEETIQYIIKFLSREVFWLNLFISILIDENERNYWVDLLPSLIFLSMIKNNVKIEKEKFCDVIKSMYKRSSSFLDTIVASEVHSKIYNILDECINNQQLIEQLISQKILDNNNFQTKHTKWLKFFFTSEGCLFYKIGIPWSELSELKIDIKSKDLELIYQEGIRGISRSIKMKSIAECSSANLILSVQMDMMQDYHCEHIKMYNSEASLMEHWTISHILHNTSLLKFAKLSQNDYEQPPKLESIGNNCYINIANIKVGTVGINHVCIKKLLNTDKSKKFWKMILNYSQWSHPHILKFYGILDGKLALFRECAEGPLITYLIKGRNDQFTFADFRQVLSQVGSALHYLHDNLKQHHGNVTLQRIMMVGQCYKLCESSLDKREVKNYQCLSDPRDKIDLSACSEQTHDLWQLLYSVVAIFYINVNMHRQQISRSTLDETQCNQTMKELIVKWLSPDYRMGDLMKDLVATRFTNDENSLVLVQAKNELVPEVLKIVARDANMFEVIKIAYSELKIMSRIGKGHFSKVSKAEWQQAGNKPILVAVKEINEKNLKSMTLLRELRPSTMVSHRNVLKSIGYSLHNGTMYVITELGESSLYDYLNRNKTCITNEICLDFCAQICEGMQFMSDENKIIHRDMATRNVIVFRQSTGYLLKISDFGLTVLLKDRKDYYACDESANHLWLPKQDIDNKKYSLKTDIYSYGVVMWEIFTRGESPRDKDLWKPKDIYPGGYEIIQKCHSENPQDRPHNFKAIRVMLEDLTVPSSSISS